MPIYGWIAIAGGTVVLALSVLQRKKNSAFLIAAGLYFAACGDYLLAHGNSGNAGFLFGIAAFGAAYLAYAMHALQYGKACWKNIGIAAFVMALLLALCFWGKAWLLAAWPLRIVGGIYLCITALAAGITASRRPVSAAGVCGFLGCFLLAISDCFLIGEQFLHVAWCKNLCIPIYSLSLLTATLGGILDVMPRKKAMEQSESQTI